VYDVDDVEPTGMRKESFKQYGVPGVRYADVEEAGLLRQTAIHAFHLQRVSTAIMARNGGRRM